MKVTLSGAIGALLVFCLCEPPKADADLFTEAGVSADAIFPPCEEGGVFGASCGQTGSVPGVGGTRAEISGSALARANYGSLHGTASIEWLSGIPLSFGGESIADAKFDDVLTITGYVGSGFVQYRFSGDGLPGVAHRQHSA